MRPAFLSVAAFLLAIACAAAAPSTAPATQPATDPILAGHPDAGVFRIYKDDDQLVKIDFNSAADGSYTGHVHVTIGRLKADSDTVISVGPDGRWAVAEGTVIGAGHSKITRHGQTVQIDTNFAGSQSAPIKPGTVIYDNYSPALNRLVLDAAAAQTHDAIGATAKVPLLILPGILHEMDVTRLADAQVPLNGKDQTFRRYQLGPAPLCTLWADPDRRVLMLDVPEQHASIVRDGYDALRLAAAAAANPDPTLSKPDCDISLRGNVAVPMRDKVQLATDIYLPVPPAAASQTKFPVVLIRTPYGKDATALQARFYARRGYAVAVQDVRGRFDSPGTFQPFLHEKEDGYDTIEWLAKQDFSSGKVGTIGGSYLGMVQWEAASLRPPHLACMIPNVSPPDPQLNVPFEHGCLLMASLWWLDVVESKATVDLSGAQMARINANDLTSPKLSSLPVIDLDKKILGHESKSWRAWMKSTTSANYWAGAMFDNSLKDVNVPAFHQSGWFDDDGIGTKLNYLAMTAAGHPYQKLTIGPWPHTDTAVRRVGTLDFGPNAIIDLQRDYLRWFDHFLKGVDNGIDREPLVSLFVMGSNTWVHGPTYPLPSTKSTRWYIHSAGNANTSAGDGILSSDPPSNTGELADKYSYNPADPTPSTVLDTTPPSTQPATTAPARTWHDKVLESRRDILVYTTAKATKPFTFAGPVSATLYAATTARDTDWYVTLSRIDTDGRDLPLCQGRLRASYRNSDTTPTPIRPGAIQRYDLDLWHTAITIKPGQRLELQIASAAFPLWARNLNTGNDNYRDTKFITAHQTIYHDAEHPTCITLPMIPNP